MNAAEKDALAWLDRWDRPVSDPDGINRDTLKAMLAQPRLPEEPTPEMLGVILDVERYSGEPCALKNAADIYRALYAHLTKPKTKTVEVWHVETAIRGAPHVCASSTREEAERIAATHRQEPNFKCVRVTGPHTHEIPT